MDPENTDANIMLKEVKSSEELGDDTRNMEKLQYNDNLSELNPMPNSICLKEKTEVGNMYSFSTLFPIMQSTGIFSELVVKPQLTAINRVEDDDSVKHKFRPLIVKPKPSTNKENISEKSRDSHIQILKSPIRNSNHIEIENIDELQDGSIFSDFKTTTYCVNEPENDQNSDVEKKDYNLEAKSRPFSTKGKISKKKFNYIPETYKHQIDKKYLNENSIEEIVNSDQFENMTAVSETIAKPCSGDGPEDSEDSDKEENKIYSTKNKLHKMESNGSVENSRQTIFNSNCIVIPPQDMINNELLQCMDTMPAFRGMVSSTGETEAETETENYNTEDETCLLNNRAKSIDSIFSKKSMNILPEFVAMLGSIGEAAVENENYNTEDDTCLSNHKAISTDSIFSKKSMNILPEFVAMLGSIGEASAENENYNTEDETCLSVDKATSMDNIFINQSYYFEKDSKCEFNNSNCVESSPQDSVFQVNGAPISSESRHLARTCLSFITGFCIGLLYGLANSYTDVSYTMSDLYCAIYFVFYLILYLVFF